MKYTKILSIMVVSCVVGLFLVIGIRLQAQNESKEKLAAVTENEQRPQASQRSVQSGNRQQGSNWTGQGRQQNFGGQGRQQNFGGQGRQQNFGGQQRSNNSESSNSTDFYRVIVDNNIFRPLGWRPPKREPQYTFIGTSVSADGTKLEGYVLEKQSNRFYTAVIGDKIGDAVVTDIKTKQILLDNNGEVITLKAGNMQFLQSGSSRGGSSRGNATNRNENNDDNRRASSSFSDKDKAAAEAKAKEEAERRAREERMRRWQEGMSRFRNASTEQRERMMREYRERSRGGDRRGGRDR